MPASVASPADVANAALVRIGHPLRLGSLFDGSLAAKKSLDVYAQTRDEMLRELDPSFATREAALIVLKTAPQGGYVPPNLWNPQINPLTPWNYSYRLPTDFIKFKAAKTAPLLIPNPLPSPELWRLYNDNVIVPPATAPPGQVLLLNIANAILVYIGQVTDPSAWDASFTEALIAALARRLTVALADPKLLQIAAQDEVAETRVADMIQG